MEETITLGMKVVRTNGHYRDMWPGDTATVTEINLETQEIAFEEYGGYHHIDNFKPVKEEQPKKKEEEHMDKWGFKVASVGAIDFDKIGSLLSYKEPICFVTAKTTDQGKDNEFFLLIHDTLLEKAYFCKGGRKLIDRLNELAPDTGQFYKDTYSVRGIEGDNVKARIVKIVKEIKKAPYKKKYRYHADVEVTLPNVNE